MTEQAPDDDRPLVQPTANRASRADASHDDVEAWQSAGDVRPVGVGGKTLVMGPWQGLLVALLGGCVVWATLQAGILPQFRLPPELEALTGPAVAPRLQEIFDLNHKNRLKNAIVGLVLLAFTLGLVLTAAELIVRRNPSRAVWGGLLAGLVASVFAVGSGIAGGALSDALGPTDNPMITPLVAPLVKVMLVQGAVLGVIGIGIGVAISLSMPRPRPLVNCIGGCLLGALLAALIFPPTVGILLPNEYTEGLVPDSRIGGLLWIGLVTGLIGVTVTGLGRETKKVASPHLSSSKP